MSSGVKTTSAAGAPPLAPVDTGEHQALQRGHALLLEQCIVGQPDIEPGFELVDDPDLGQRVPALDSARPVVVADFDVPSEHLLEHLAEGAVKPGLSDHGCSAM